MTEKIDFHKQYFEGEMLPYERYKLYNWILEIKPKVVFEIGTGLGGGSTFYISSALKNSDSVLYTCDPIRTPEKEFFDSFEFIKYSKEYSDVFLQKLISTNILPNFIMFDGPENPEVAYNDILFLEKHIKNNTYFCMHDWDKYRPYDGNTSTKSVKIRDYIEKSNKWELIEQLHSDKKNSDFDNNTYDSVGLCLYKFKGN